MNDAVDNSLLWSLSEAAILTMNSSIANMEHYSEHCEPVQQKK